MFLNEFFSFYRLSAKKHSVLLILNINSSGGQIDCRVIFARVSFYNPGLCYVSVIFLPRVNVWNTLNISRKHMITNVGQVHK